MANDKTNGKLTGADIVVKTLEQRGVKWVFGIPGAKIDTVFNTLVDSSIQTIVCRHEQNAAFIAGGVGRMTGKAGVAIGTSGPGTSNLVTGVVTANTEGDPIVALAGAVSLSERLKQTHQSMDSVGLFKPVTKYSAEVDSAESTAEVLTNAFRAAESDRPGAAFVSLPKDIMAKPAECEVLSESKFGTSGTANEKGLEEAAHLLNQARKPVVLLGMLASKPENAAAIRQLLEAETLPVVSTFQAAGSVPLNLFRNFGGRVGLLANQPGDKILDTADLVVTIGFDPVEYDPAIWNKGHRRAIIHIDALRADIDNSYNPVVELIGDVAATVISLLPLISKCCPESEIRHLLDAIALEREQLTAAAKKMNGTPIHPLRIVTALQDFLTPDTTLCSDMGSFHIWLARHLYSFRARQFLISNGQQTLGVALPWGIAATLVRPA